MFHWFRDLSITGKFACSFFIMLVGFSAAGFYAWDAIETNDQLTTMALKARNLRNNMNNTRIAVSQLIIRRYAGDSRPEMDVQDRSDISVNTTDAFQTIKDLQAQSGMIHNEKVDDDLKKLEDATKQYVDLRDNQQLQALREGDLKRAAGYAYGINRERFRQIRETALDLGDRCADVARERGEAASRMFLLIGALLVLTSTVLFTALQKTVARPLREITKAADRLALGDTTTRVEVLGSMDEVGAISRSFDLMSQSWKTMAETAKRVAGGDLSAKLTARSEHDIFVHSFNVLVESMAAITMQFRDAVKIVSSTSSQILISVNQSAVGANETATAANETSAIVEQVRQTSHVASQKARQVSDSAQKTAQITAAGRKATEDIIEGMNRIREQVDLIAEAMVRLSEKSQSISGIIATVDDLAKQSNLLAVNASIEAARAGELGRGFGVVALEVKNMAAQSKQSTAQVRAIIAEIQQATNAAAMATELGGKAVDAALHQSGRAGESIAVLAGSVLESAQAAAQIAVSNQQQLAGVDQVANAMTAIRDACEEHIVAIKQVEIGATRLNEIGAKLKVLVDRYDVWSNLDSGFADERPLHQQTAETV